MIRASTAQPTRSKSGPSSVSHSQICRGNLSPDNPIHRFRTFLVDQGWWTEAEEAALLAKHKSDVLISFKRAEKLPKPKLSEMFNDVWAVPRGGQVPRVIVSIEPVGTLVQAECAGGTTSRAWQAFEEVR